MRFVIPIDLHFARNPLIDFMWVELYAILVYYIFELTAYIYTGVGNKPDEIVLLAIPVKFM